MKSIGNWNNITPITDREPLPKGGYLVKIMDARLVEYKPQDGDPFEKLEISLDIMEGDFKDYFAEDYRSQQSEDKRWKGVLRLYLPKEDGTEKDEWTMRTLKTNIQAIEDSNPGYHWDWDETKLKNKVAGCVFRSEEWSFNGRSGWSTRPFRLIAADKIRAGKFRIPNDKPLKERPTGGSSIDITVDDGDLPF